MSFFDQPLRVTRFKLVHAMWRRQRMEMLPGVVPVSLLLARTDNTVVGLTDVRGYPAGFVFLDQYPFVPEDLPPDQPVLVEGGGVGSEGGRLGRGAFWDLELAVQPLPPPGPLAFVCAWPGRGISEVRWPLGHQPRSGPQRSRGAGVRAADAEQRARDRRGSRRLELRHGLPAPAPAPTRAARLRLRVAGPRHPIGTGRGRRRGRPPGGRR